MPTRPQSTSRARKKPFAARCGTARSAARAKKFRCIGLGGYHIGVQNDVQDSIRIIRTAIDRGINFLDNSWDYHMGGSEIRMGKASRTAIAKKSS